MNLKLALLILGCALAAGCNNNSTPASPPTATPPAYSFSALSAPALDLLNQGQAAWERHDYPQAIRFYKQILAEYNPIEGPTNQDGTKANLYWRIGQNYVAMGREYSQHKEWGAAVAAFKYAREYLPGDTSFLDESTAASQQAINQIVPPATASTSARPQGLGGDTPYVSVDETEPYTGRPKPGTKYFEAPTGPGAPTSGAFGSRANTRSGVDPYDDPEAMDHLK